MVQSPDAALDREQLAQWLTLSGRGDESAFAKLYEHSSSKLYGVCLRMLRDRGEAEDTLQEVFTTVWRRASSFDASKASAMTWLITLSRNKSIDRLRKRREAVGDDSMIDGFADDAPTPPSHAQTSQDHQRLDHCLDELEDKHRSAVREAFFSGATYNELADRCSVPLGTMKSWIRRSLIKLRTCLER
ncbi:MULTISPECIES: sigma-70 family RNA polymerase sigma factor [Oleiagrimonas]|jgi:RNA polymerase sigma factor (sigma-70 family)|uniref:Sigma-70 family RNA polymerase sigma factor n=1 Tax=Oleiagrimonas citrea TaxID=1665687 RepID=A0A846ZM79_9GAMM|nr:MULTISPECIES: sigma-70 family RNA polymerase sigma factor [Oleiagrimonas]NKZ39076.1 sigma-70 family RNA polymerase sigma factor [Oleiagrimonas citrea]RAP57684.1 RNA polymerase subunit sigma [Oleiagrimonas sp. MCCC 1A03011]